MKNKEYKYILKNIKNSIEKLFVFNFLYCICVNVSFFKYYIYSLFYFFCFSSPKNFQQKVAKYVGCMGSAVCRNEGHWLPKFSVGANNDFGLPKIWEVYNNSNLVNNEVFKKLTTKLTSIRVASIGPKGCLASPVFLKLVKV